MKAHPKSQLTDEQMAVLRARLMKVKREMFERTRRRVPFTEGDPLEQGAAAGDAADRAEGTFEQELNRELSESDRQLLHEIDDGLARMADGRYGVCEATGEPIGFDRLSVEPWARYTSAYQERLEKDLGATHPPKL